MTEDFRSGRLSFLQKFYELNQKLYSYNAGLTLNHPDGSKWYQWPLGRKPVIYWTENSERGSAHIYLTVNPVNGWLTLVGVAGMLGLLAQTARRQLSYLHRSHYLLIATGYFFNLALFSSVGRVTFLYHYLPSLIMGLVGAAVFADHLLSKRYEWNRIGLTQLMIAVIIGFILTIPVIYGVGVSGLTLRIVEKVVVGL